MPYADLARKRAHGRAYHAANRARCNANSRAYYQANKDKWLKISIARITASRALIAAARGLCVDCGRPSEHFHHLDPSTKLFGLARPGRYAQNIKAIEAEIAKCVPLCSLCHRKRHA
jgi:hypothetical protein